jgi:serine phosphatase RsbU (regulator of sigma subunit)
MAIPFVVALLLFSSYNFHATYARLKESDDKEQKIIRASLTLLLQDEALALSDKLAACLAQQNDLLLNTKYELLDSIEFQTGSRIYVTDSELKVLSSSQKTAVGSILTKIVGLESWDFISDPDSHHQTIAFDMLTHTWSLVGRFPRADGTLLWLVQPDSFLHNAVRTYLEKLQNLLPKYGGEFSIYCAFYDADDKLLCRFRPTKHLIPTAKHEQHTPVVAHTHTNKENLKTRLFVSRQKQNFQWLADTYTTTHLTVLMLISVVSITLIGWFSRRLLSPILAITNTLQNYENDAIGHNKRSNEPTELHDLGTKIDSLFATLERNHAEREAEFQCRTREIDEKNKELEQQNHELNEINHFVDKQSIDILSGLKAAERLQKLILPHEDELIELFVAAFIINMPKDFVSGDFYWTAHIEGRHIIALGDCTGHGISGAILSILGNELLNQIVRREKLTDPARILTNLDHGLKSVFHNSRNGYFKDGMDLAICSIDPETWVLEYALANSRMYHYHHGSVTELVGNKISVGDADDKAKQKFTNHTLQLSNGDSLYLTSDGYSDQFGGPNDKKFSRKRLRAQIEKIGKLPISMQKLIFIKEFDQWKADNFQVDDVMVIGIRF